MKNTFEKGITMISLVVMIIVILILSGVTLGVANNKNNGLINKTVDTKGNVEKETLKQRIQSDLFKEKTKKGRDLTQSEKEDIVDNYGTITEENGERVLKTTEGNYEILLSEIIL